MDQVYAKVDDLIKEYNEVFLDDLKAGFNAQGDEVTEKQFNREMDNFRDDAKTDNDGKA